MECKLTTSLAEKPMQNSGLCMNYVYVIKQILQLLIVIEVFLFREWICLCSD